MLIADSYHICWENRLRGDHGKTCKICVNRTDFKTYDTKSFDTSQYLQKFNGPEERYEVVTCIQTGDIVHINGPFKPGKFADLSIFCLKIKQLLLDDFEKAEANLGYRGEPETVLRAQMYFLKSEKNKSKSESLS